MPPKARGRWPAWRSPNWGREIVATTMAVNTGSRRVLEKAGLRYARTVHLDWPDPLDGSEHGDVEYRLPRADWAAAHETVLARPRPRR
jgi:RimJ/RimL family protein N-acetyltransferase